MTSGPGDATELARAAVKQSRPLVVAAGGDGTIHEVANGFFEEGLQIPTTTRLGVLPTGSGGDFRRTFDIPLAPEAAGGVLLAGKTRRIDAGRATFRLPDGGTGIRHFINIADAGVGGEVVNRVNRSSKRLGGTLTFRLAVIRSLLAWSNTPVHVVVDGEAFDLLCQQVVIANCQYFGSGLRMAPMADPADGELDVIVVGDVGRFFSLTRLKAIQNGTHLDEGDPRLKVLRARNVQLSSPDTVRIDLDGEQPGVLPASFEVMPGSIDLVVP
jgi:diacylglycerol kinase (ATP)